jgi:hypothetical protein
MREIHAPHGDEPFFPRFGIFIPYSDDITHPAPADGFCDLLAPSFIIALAEEVHLVY